MDFEHKMSSPEWSKPFTTRGGAAERASPFDGCAVVLDSTTWGFPAKPRGSGGMTDGMASKFYCGKCGEKLGWRN